MVAGSQIENQQSWSGHPKELSGILQQALLGFAVVAVGAGAVAVAEVLVGVSEYVVVVLGLPVGFEVG